MKHTEASVETPKIPFPEALWAGTEQSLDMAIAIHSAIVGRSLVGGRSLQDGEEEEVPYNYSLQGSVGVISIRGSLLNSESKYARYYGATTYNDIREAVIYAAKDPNAKAILLDIDSGGGAVSGLAETAQLIKTVSDNVKSVYSYTPGTMASAAYWLGVSGKSVYTSKTAVVGSIGVITTHMEYSKAYEEAGIGVKVLRAGKYKALANPYEPLSKTGEEQILGRLDAAYSIFVDWVAEGLGSSAKLVDEKMAQGREFFGTAAVDVGLAQGIETFDSIVQKINGWVLDTISSGQNNSSSFAKGPNMKQAFSEVHIAAAQAGVDLSAADPAPSQEASGSVEPSVSAKVTEPEEKNNQGEALAILRDELRLAQTNHAKATVQVEALQAQIDAQASTMTALAGIVAKSVSQMRVGLGHAASDLSAMRPEAILAEHAAVSEAFLKQFKAGGVAAVQPQQADGADKGGDSAPEWLSRVGLTRLSRPTK